MEMKKLSMATIVGLVALSTSSLVAAVDTTKLDTLVLYSQGAADKYDGDVETRINHLIATTNKIYEDSGLNVKLNPVKIQQYEMDDSAKSGTILGQIRKDANVTAIRNSVGADNVVIYRPYAHDGVCGLAYQNNSLNNPSATWVEKYMFAHVTIDCGGYVTAHEVGHDSGLGHSAAQGSTGAYEYARGHGVQDAFTTVMAYSSAYNGKKIYKYSSPTLDCNGLPCGIDEGEENAADAVKALNQTLPLIEKFRKHIDNNNSTEDNGTTDDGTKKFADALKAYEDQKAMVQTLKEKLAVFRTVRNEQRQAYIDLLTEYKTQRAAYLEKRTEYKELRSSYREVLTRYKQARTNYRAKTITRDQLLVVRSELQAARERYKAYYTTILKPEYTTLKAYITDRLKPAYVVYREAVTDYRNFIKERYRPAKVELNVLKKKYLELKKVYG